MGGDPRHYVLDFSGARSLPRHTVFVGLVHALVFMCVWRLLCASTIKQRCVHECVFGFSYVCVHETSCGIFYACESVHYNCAAMCVCMFRVRQYVNVCGYILFAMCVMQGRPTWGTLQCVRVYVDAFEFTCVCNANLYAYASCM